MEGEPKIYQIYEILSIAAEWMDDPENEEAAVAFDEMQRSLVIRDYMPLGQKEILLKKTFLDIKSDEQIMPYTASILCEIAFAFDCILAYVVNLDPNIDDLYKDASFYDLLQTSGLLSYIMAFCKDDCERLRKLVDRMISFDNLMELTKNFEMASPEQIADLTAEFKRFTMDTDSKFLKSLGEIAAFNDPLMTSVKNNIENAAYQAATAGNSTDEKTEEPVDENKQMN